MLSVPSVVDTLLCRLKNNLSITLCMQVTQGGLYSVGVWVDVVLFGCSVASMAVKSLVCRLLPLRRKLSWVLVGLRVGSYHCIISFCALFFADGASTVLFWTEVPGFPSLQVVQAIQQAESPSHGQNYSLTPTTLSLHPHCPLSSKRALV